MSLLVLAGCASAPREEPAAPSLPPPAESEPPQSSPLGGALVRSARKLLGASTITSGGRRVGYDCAGVMRAIFLEHGIDLYAGSEQGPSVNGVRRIFENVRANGRMHTGPGAAPGDLVFFDNTWDFNADGRANDRLTHVGLVERVEADGTVLFISRVASAIQRYHMNLLEPHYPRAGDGRLLNDYLRRRRPQDRADVRYLAGELFAGFGRRVER